MNIVGTGSYLPSHIVSNDDLASIVDTTDEWIMERTGIKERRLSNGEENTELAAKAASKALQDAQVSPEEIDLIIVASATSEYLTPSMACILAYKLGIPNAIAFDINAACSGFLYALNTAYGYLEAGMAETALIVGSETLSKIVDYTDRGTCILFGDGAGAVIIQKGDNKLFASSAGSDGTRHDVIQCMHRPLSNLVVSKENKIDYLHMNGQEVYKFVVSKIPEVIKNVVEKAELQLGDIKYFILHQANKRINEIVAKKLGIDFELFPCNLHKTGNTSAASIGILLDEMNKSGRLTRGDKIVLCAFGAGMTWATIVLEW